MRSALLTEAQAAEQVHAQLALGAAADVVVEVEEGEADATADVRIPVRAGVVEVIVEIGVELREGGEPEDRVILRERSSP